MKNYKYIGLSLLVAAGLNSCSTSKTLVSNGEYDDMYGTSSDAPVAYAPTMSKSTEAYAPEYLTDYNDAYDRMPVDSSSMEGTETYYDENYVNSSSLKRAYTPDAGYSSGYADGYSEGWNEYAWSGSRNLNGFNSFNNPWGGGGYGYNSFAYSPFRSSFGSYLSYSPFAYGGYYGMSSFGFSPWGGGGFSPYGYGSSFGYGYMPWGYGSAGSYYGGYGYSNPYYGVQPVLAGDSRYSGNRSYGPRSSGRSTSIYNDGFVNTRRPVSSTTATTRRTTGTTSTRTNSGIADRANGSSTSGRTYTTARRPTTYDAYTRSTGNSVSRTSANSNDAIRRTTSSSNNAARTSTYTRSTARTSSPSSSGYSRSSSPSGTSTYGGNSNSGYSRPATTSSSTRSTSTSSGSYSRGSSSSSSSSSSSRASSSSSRPR